MIDRELGPPHRSYESYDWDEMRSYTQIHLVKALGLIQNLWDNDGKSSAFDGMDWNEFIVVEKTATLGIAYPQKLWGGASLPFWVSCPEISDIIKLKRIVIWVAKYLNCCSIYDDI